MLKHIFIKSYCPEPHETAKRQKSNCDVIYKIKKRNMMSLSESTNNDMMIRVNLKLC